jgi:hypothetical protein
MRNVLTYVLCTLLAVTGLGLAQARGSVGPLDRVEICHGLGTEIIVIDAEGKPVKTPHLCPDGIGLISLAGFLPPALPAPGAVRDWAALDPAHIRAAPPPEASARGPPFVM